MIWRPDGVQALSGIAKTLLAAFPSKIVTLRGAMGSGKTTLVGYLIKELGSKDVIQSPTYSLINEYRSGPPNEEPIYHFDFYRLHSSHEALDLGVEEYLESGCYCFLEWPDLIDPLLPALVSDVRLTVEESGRKIELLM